MSNFMSQQDKFEKYVYGVGTNVKQGERKKEMIQHNPLYGLGSCKLANSKLKRQDTCQVWF